MIVWGMLIFPNHFKPVQKSRKQVLKAYCHYTYTVTPDKFANFFRSEYILIQPQKGGLTSKLCCIYVIFRFSFCQLLTFRFQYNIFSVNYYFQTSTFLCFTIFLLTMDVMDHLSVTVFDNFLQSNFRTM